MRIITDLPSINIEEPTDLVVAHAKQSDKLTRWFRAPLLQGADPWTPPTNGTATIKFLKADGHSGWYDCLENGDLAVEVDGTNVIFGMAAQALSAAGRATVSIEWFTPAGERISGFNLYIDVEADPNPDAHIVSTDYYNVLSVQVAAVLNAAENLTGIEVDSTTLAIGASPTVSVTGGGTQPYTIHFGIPAGPLESLTAEAHGLPTGSNPTVEVTGGGTTPFHFNLGVPVGSVGPAGIAVQDSAPTSNELVWIDTDESPEEIIVPEINDNVTNTVDTWSGSKITSEITSYVPEETSDNYVKFPGGLLIQWGSTASLTVSLTQQGSSGIYGQYVSVTFPVAFGNASYHVFGSFKYATGASWPVGAANVSKSNANLWVWDTYARSGNDGRLSWMAIGRWK